MAANCVLVAYGSLRGICRTYSRLEILFVFFIINYVRVVFDVCSYDLLSQRYLNFCSNTQAHGWCRTFRVHN